MGTNCSCETFFSSGGAVIGGDLLAEEDEAEDQVGELVMYESTAVPGKSDKRLPRLLGSESVPSPSTTESTAAESTFSLHCGSNVDGKRATAEDRFSVDLDRYENSTGSMTHRHISDPALNTGRHSEAYFEVSSYPVCEALNRYKSRHVIWAPSPTHSVHRSEKSVPPYAEVYGMHPASFDFNKRGQKIDSYGCAIGPDGTNSPCDSRADSDDDSPPHDGRFGRQIDFTMKTSLSTAKVVQAPRAPPGAILYN